MTSLQIGILLITLLVLGFLLEALRRRQLRVKYAALWLVLGGGVALLGVFPSVLDGVAGWLGIADPPNLLFFIAVTVLLAVNVHQSWELSRLEEETRTLAEEIALLRLDVDVAHHEEHGDLPADH